MSSGHEEKCEAELEHQEEEELEEEEEEEEGGEGVLSISVSIIKRGNISTTSILSAFHDRSPCTLHQRPLLTLCEMFRRI